MRNSLWNTPQKGPALCSIQRIQTNSSAKNYKQAPFLSNSTSQIYPAFDFWLSLYGHLTSLVFWDGLTRLYNDNNPHNNPLFLILQRDTLNHHQD